MTEHHGGPSACAPATASEGHFLRSASPRALNKRLRTGADKGNPLRYLKRNIAMAGDDADAM